MSFSKRWFISLSSCDSEKSLSFSLSKRLSIALGAVLSLLFVITMTYAVIGISKHNSSTELTELQEQNKILTTQIDKVTTSIDSIASHLKRMEDWENEIRGEKNLKSINEAVRLQGVGGEFIVDSLFLQLPDTLSTKLISFIRKSDELERRVAFDLESHLDVLSLLTKRSEIYKYTPSIYPTYGRISDKYGWRRHPITKKRSYHYGIDFSNRTGTPIYATADGVVKKTGRLRKFGRYINLDHKYGYKTKYAHLHKILVKKGDIVKKGQIIALMGNTGRSTGPHLHYEIHHYDRYRNPYSYLTKDLDEIKVSSR